ncbi:MAG TPA: ion channel [Bryobacteraceae bacterium]|nr:ion channel [Bryobacteraceae bacterium]
MRAIWLGKSLKLVGALLASLFLNLPIDLYRNGRNDVMVLGSAIAIPFVGVGVLEFLRHSGRLRNFLAQRSFDGMLVRTFMCTLPSFVANVIAAFSPTLYSGGLQYGMLVGLLTVAPYATLDRPQITDLRYWMKSGVAIAVALGGLIYFLGGRSAAALIHALGSALVYLAGLWLGLMLGNNVNKWIVALQPTFQLLRVMGTTLMAFAVGYFAIVTVFSTLFAAVWRLAGSDSFAGLPASPALPTFMYFSLVTATTVGYGDIVPKSAIARSLTGLEAIVSLAWTLVVFAALSVRFAAAAVHPKSPNREPQQ